MLRHTFHALVLLCGVAVVLDIGYHLGRGSLLPSAEGQGAESDLIITAANTQSEAFCFAFNRKTGQLASYMQRSVGGLELKGIRNTNADFNPQFNEFPRSESQTAVKNMKKLAEQLAKDKEKEKDKDK